MSRRDLKLVLDWIGFQADGASLKTFFAQKDLTILATWEALNSTVMDRKHAAAFDTLLSVHVATRHTAPWVEGRTSHGLIDYLELAPNAGSKLIKTYPCDQNYLNNQLGKATRYHAPVEVVSLLISAGASLTSDCSGASVDDFIRYLRWRCQEYPGVDLSFLQHFLEGGAVVDRLDFGDVGWLVPRHPIYTTDYLLLSEGNSAQKASLVSLVCSYSDRQETIVTIPGIFEASRAGPAHLRFYLNARPIPQNDRDRMQVLEIALSEASERGDVDVLHTLIQFGVDPNVRMLSKDAESRNKHGEWESSTWHPVIRAADAGKVDVLRILVAAPDIDVSLIDEQFPWLDYFDPRSRWLRELNDSKLDHILRLLSTLDFSLRTRNHVLVYGLAFPKYGSGHCDPDFGFVNRLLKLGLASADQDHRDRENPQGHILVRALESGCGFSAFNYLVGHKMRILYGISASIISELFERVTCKPRRSETYAILEFLAQKVEGFMTHVQEQKSFLLRRILQNLRSHTNCPYKRYRGNKCGTMGAADWLLGLGATLDARDFWNLIPHTSESFMLYMIEDMSDIDVLDGSHALKSAIGQGWFNLAMALIERGVQISGLQPVLPMDHQTVLQHACGRAAPLWFIRYLINKGADVNGPPNPDGGWTALQYAAGGGFMNMAELLLNRGADVNARSGRVLSSTSPGFMRAIDVAALFTRLDMVHFLIKAGARSARPGLTGFDGAIKIATEWRHLAIAALLQKHAESGREERVEAERRWLLANSHACMDNGAIRPRFGPSDGQ